MDFSKKRATEKTTNYQIGWNIEPVVGCEVPAMHTKPQPVNNVSKIGIFTTRITQYDLNDGQIEKSFKVLSKWKSQQ